MSDDMDFDDAQGRFTIDTGTEATFDDLAFPGPEEEERADSSGPEDAAADETRDDDASLPKGFMLREAGVYREMETEGGSKWVWLCSPIRVLALPRDRSGKGWGRLVEITDPDGRKHRWAIPAELFAGDGAELRREAFRLGLRLSTSRNARAAFSDLLQNWTPAARAVTADRLGWADETCSAFVLGDGGVIGAANVVYQNENAPTAGSEMRPVGTLEDWRTTVATACVENPVLLVSVSLAFAGALLEPLGVEGGGLHLRGASSRGKSTAQRAAVSVWGSPKFLHTWRATANGLEGVAAASNGTILALDEMAEISGREAGAAAYMLANGQGKARASRTGAARPAARWRVMILSSGEISLADKVAEAGGRAAAGQAVRLLDIAADSREHGAFDTIHGKSDGAAFADAVNRWAAASHGTAGPAFVGAFLARREECENKVRNSASTFIAEARQRLGLTSEGQTERALGRFALIAAAGELATTFGITGWPQGVAQEAALTILRLWTDGRGGAGPSEACEAVERVRAFIVAHGSSRFERLNAEEEQRVVNRAGWCDGGHYYVSSDAWREIHAGADPTRAARYLADAGYLICEGKHMKARLPRTVPGRPRAYAISVDVMGAGSDD